jgi:hypothetical protein
MRSLARNLMHGQTRDAELAAEVRSYVDLLTDEKMAAGMPPDLARRAALLEIGSVETLKEHARAVRVGTVLAELWRDARYAIRAARRDPGFTSVAVLTLALGIGANTAIFSVVNTVLLKPLSYRDPDRLVFVWERNTSVGKVRDLVSPLNLQDWRNQNTVFDELGTYRLDGFTLSGVEEPESVSALNASGSLFRVLCVDAVIGRAFTDDEERRRDRVVVLTHEFWQRRFGGDTNLVGRSITLSGDSFVVVGVMPVNFRFPEGTPVDLYSPLVFTKDELTGRRARTP